MLPNPQSFDVEAPPVEIVVARAEELAQLSRIEYDRVRDAEAKQLGIRVGTLDREVARRRPPEEPTASVGLEIFNEPEPWPEPVDGAELMKEIEAEIRRYVYMPKASVDSACLWILGTHVLAAFDIFAILHLTSPAPSCGKSTALGLVESLARKALYTTHASTASLFRLIEADRPTLILDECDTYLEDNHELRGLLDSGHVINGRFIRCDGDDNNPRPFSTFCPKAIGGIGGVHATIASRAITIKLQRKPSSVKTEKLKFNCRDYLIETKQKAMRWAMDNIDALRSIRPAMPQLLSDRSEDNWTPLCAIAELIGHGWVERAHAAAVALEDIGSAQSVHVKLLEDIRTVFGTRDKVSSQALAEDLARIETSPWPEYKNGKPISPRQIARLLAGFEINPSSVRMPDGSTPKGYRLAQFEGVFKGYLQPVSNATTPQATEINGSGPEAIRNGGADVADRKQSEMADLLRGGGVADENPETAGGSL